jgi:hypothetical protein
MAKTITHKVAREGISNLVALYLKAANNENLHPSVRESLTNKWAMLREISWMLTYQDGEALDRMINEAKSWVKSSTGQEA